VTDAYLNPNDGFAAAAVALPTNVAIIGFAKGIFAYRSDRSELPPGAPFQVMAAVTGWLRFHGPGQPPERIVDVPGKPSPSRSELGDNDPAKWKKGLNGQPQDPWAEVAELALVSDDTGLPAVFSTTTNTGRRAVGQLVREIVWGRYSNGPAAIAVIELHCGKLRNAYETLVPRFPIVRWIAENVNVPKALPVAEPVAKSALPSAEKPTGRAEAALAKRLTGKLSSSKLADDLDDDIPM
jgi:hypothetical protein